MASVILIAVVLAAGQLLPETVKFFQRFRAQHQLTTESRTAMDTIAKALRQGRPSTVVICGTGPCRCDGSDSATCTPPAYTPPSSRMEFGLPGGAATYAIYWSAAAIHLREVRGATVYEPRKLADNATGFTFIADFRDPAVVLITMRLDKAVDAAQDALGNPRNVASVFVPNRVVRMEGAP